MSVAGFSSCVPNGRLFHVIDLPPVCRCVSTMPLSYAGGNGVLGSGGAERPEEQPESGAR